MDEAETSGVVEAGGGDGMPPTTPTITTPTVTTVRENLANLLELKKVHSERLEKVDEELSKLQKFKKDYEHLLKRMKTIADKISHEVMVPLGPLALMPGHLVHTNEVLVLLGDNWFAERSAKQASDIVRRRIKDCEEKIREVEKTRHIHTGWLKEADEVLQGSEGDRVEIIEEMTEEEYQRSQEEHRRQVNAQYSRLREEAPYRPPSPPPSPPPFVDELGDVDRKSYEDLMKRLDQLEIEEMGEMEALEEEEEEEEEEDEDFDDDDEEEEDDEEGIFGKEEDDKEEGEGDSKKEIDKITGKSQKHRPAPKPRPRLHSAEAGGCVDDDGSNTDSEGGERGSRGGDRRITLPRKHRLKRRVSWADDARPLYTIIPDDNSVEVHHIPYSSGPPPPLPLALPVGGAEGAGGAEGGVQSPSDIYRVFGQPLQPVTSAPTGGKEAGKDVAPRSILKKSCSLPIDGSHGGAEEEGEGGDGWCCPPKPLDVDGEGEEESLTPEELPPPPPSPPPKRALSLKPAFSYRVLERKLTDSAAAAAAPTVAAAAAAPSVTTTTQPKKISKFRAARMKK